MGLILLHGHNASQLTDGVRSSLAAPVFDHFLSVGVSEIYKLLLLLDL